MAWTTPIDWAADDPITTSVLNLQVRDNMDYLYARPRDIVYITTGNWSTTSTSFVAVDTSVMVVELDVSTGAGFEIGFNLYYRNATNAAEVSFDWYEINQGFYLSDYPAFSGAGMANGLHSETTTDARYRSNTCKNVFELDGNFTFELHWKVSSSTGWIDQGSGLGQLWMREV